MPGGAEFGEDKHSLRSLRVGESPGWSSSHQHKWKTWEGPVVHPVEITMEERYKPRSGWGQAADLDGRKGSPKKQEELFKRQEENPGESCFPLSRGRRDLQRKNKLGLQRLKSRKEKQEFSESQQ